MTTMNETLGYRIKQLRNAKGLTLAKLGEQVGSGASYLSQVESGAIPSPSMVVNLATALGAEPAGLLKLACAEKLEQLAARVNQRYLGRK